MEKKMPWYLPDANMFSLEKMDGWGLAEEGLKGVYLRLVFVDKK